MAHLISEIDPDNVPIPESRPRFGLPEPIDDTSAEGEVDDDDEDNSDPCPACCSRCLASCRSCCRPNTFNRVGTATKDGFGTDIDWSRQEAVGAMSTGPPRFGSAVTFSDDPDQTPMTWRAPRGSFKTLAEEYGCNRKAAVISAYITAVICVLVVLGMYTWFWPDDPARVSACGESDWQFADSVVRIKVENRQQAKSATRIFWNRDRERIQVHWEGNVESHFSTLIDYPNCSRWDIDWYTGTTVLCTRTILPECVTRNASTWTRPPLRDPVVHVEEYVDETMRTVMERVTLDNTTIIDRQRESCIPVAFERGENRWLVREYIDGYAGTLGESEENDWVQLMDLCENHGQWLHPVQNHSHAEDGSSARVGNGTKHQQTPPQNAYISTDTALLTTNRDSRWISEPVRTWFYSLMHLRCPGIQEMLGLALRLLDPTHAISFGDWCWTPLEYDFEQPFNEIVFQPNKTHVWKFAMDSLCYAHHLALRTSRHTRKRSIGGLPITSCAVNRAFTNLVKNETMTNAMKWCDLPETGRVVSMLQMEVKRCLEAVIAMEAFYRCSPCDEEIEQPVLWPELDSVWNAHYLSPGVEMQRRWQQWSLRAEPARDAQD